MTNGQKLLPKIKKTSPLFRPLALFLVQYCGYHSPKCVCVKEKKGGGALTNTVFDLISAHFPISAQYDNV